MLRTSMDTESDSDSDWEGPATTDTLALSLSGISSFSSFGHYQDADGVRACCLSVDPSQYRWTLPPPSLESDTVRETARYPFDNAYSDADIVLRAADGTHFYLHKAILRVASVFFAEMFSLPQPTVAPGPATGPQATCAEIPIVPVTEDSKTLELLLRLCYPVNSPYVSPTRTGISIAVPVLSAALKYQMPVVAARMTRKLSLCAYSDPLEVFAIAYTLDQEELGAYAVWLFTGWEDTPADNDTLRAHSPDEYSPKMDDIPAAVYYRLLEYHSTTTPLTSMKDARAAAKRIFSGSPPSEKLDEAKVDLGRLVHPFNDAIHACTVVSSSDDSVFHLDRALLVFASPAFAKLLLSSPATASGASETPEVHPATGRTHRFPEDGRTLSKLFQLSYPMPDPEFCKSDPPDVRLRDALSLLEAAKKYEVPRAIAFAKRACLEAADASPMRLYLLATRFNWEEEARGAALRAVYNTSDQYDPQMEFASAAAYRRFLVYRRKCRDVILSGGNPANSAYYAFGLLEQV
ncbi:uncharacterized protein B0H18DRAFT_1187290 [Fomitopsis serialis]|uniref:uncharacterized protein n=1 Tax=Fomitopsis serialis TaxID=139415 RepID=UPI002008D644|nr:uncharacterized protein B0H18DRAFT_1187290 [Neoantrodia serialis]KAH9921629.1 hypothetical protein B0H18DRAFT_1187290 [Neoantrodia serialis]